jgi:hypothetical protein
MAKKPVDTAIVMVVGPLIGDSDFKSIQTGVAYNAAGMNVDLIQESASGATKTDITLTTAGNNDWAELGNGYYSVEITAAQNNVKGNAYLVGVATNILSFRSAVYEIVPTAMYNSRINGDSSVVNAEIGTACWAAVSGNIASTGDLNTTVTNAITGNCATTGQFVNAVWNEQASGHTASGSFGSNLDAKVSSISSSSGGLTSSGVTLAVWGAASSGYTTAGTFGGDMATNTGVADSVWDELASGHSTNGSMGKMMSILRKILTNKSVENASGVVYYDDDGNTELGQNSWTEETGTRGKFTGTW